MTRGGGDNPRGATRMSVTDDVKSAFKAYTCEATRFRHFLENVTRFVCEDLRQATDDLHRHCQTLLDAKGSDAIGADGMTRLSLCLVANGLQDGTMCRERCVSLIARASFIHIYAIFNAYLSDAVLPYWPSTKYTEFNTSLIDAKIQLLESHFGLSFNPDNVDAQFLKRFCVEWHAIVHYAGQVDETFLNRVPDSGCCIGDEVSPAPDECLSVLDKLDTASREIGYRLEEFLDPTARPSIPLNDQ